MSTHYHRRTLARRVEPYSHVVRYTGDFVTDGCYQVSASSRR
jgi:hypothetical protein